MPDNINTPDHWDDAWAKHHVRYRTSIDSLAVVNHIRELIPPEASVLDIGGGCGVLADVLPNPVTIMDFSPFALEYVRERGHVGIHQDLRTYENEVYGAFDFATCLEVLEHLDDQQRAIRCAYNHAPVAFFAVPNWRMGPESCTEHVRLYREHILRAELTMWSSVEIVEVAHGHVLVARCE